MSTGEPGSGRPADPQGPLTETVQHRPDAAVEPEGTEASLGTIAGADSRPSRVLDQLCDEFEAAWRGGGRPSVEEFLAGVAESDRAAVLQELLQLERHYRSLAGESPAVEEYLKRFPEHAELVGRVFARPAPPARRSRVADDAVPAVLGDYEVLKRLGGGGMGVVYQARHRRLKRVVAIKVLKPECMEDEQARSRFAREMEAVGRVSHPNLVQALDAREEAGVCFLVMEYVEGVDLMKVLRARGRLSVADACEIARQTAVALEHACRQGLVHRDLKPSNLMLTPEGTVKVLDLGLARLQGDGQPGGELTASGTLLGTPDYIAPEQARGRREVDIRADLYSLGCTLYHFLAGRPPYGPPDHSTYGAKILAHVQEPFPQIAAIRHDVPKPLQDLLARLTAKDPSDRPASPSEVSEALRPLAEGSNLPALLPESSVPAGMPHEGVAPASPDGEGTQTRRIRKRSAKLTAVLSFVGLLVVVALILVLRPWLREGTLPEASDPQGPDGGPPAAQPSAAAKARLLQQECSRESGLAVENVNSLGMKLVLIPPGEFEMGYSPEQLDGMLQRAAQQGRLSQEAVAQTRDHLLRQRHRVVISRPYYLGKHEVTVGQFRQFVEATGYETEAETDGVGGRGFSVTQQLMVLGPQYSWRETGFAQTDDHPVVNVTWTDAVAFCQWLSTREGKSYGLPTEAQWERACRAETTTYWCHGDDGSGLARTANIADQSLKRKTQGWVVVAWDDGYPFSAPVGRFEPNGFGLHDMHGNVGEWCADWYADDSQVSPLVDPTGPKSGTHRVLRGGCWLHGVDYCASAMRDSWTAGTRRGEYGFRVAHDSAASPTTPAASRPPNTPSRRSSEDLGKAKELQHAAAKKLDLPVERPNSLGMVLVLVPPGEFEMGSSQAEADRVLREAAGQGFMPAQVAGFVGPGETPPRRVSFPQPFYLGKHEVTMGQFRKFVEAAQYKTDAEKDAQGGGGFTPSNNPGERKPYFTWRQFGLPPDDSLPAVNVSWNDATAFCQWLAEQEKRRYRLPREAEWEYACRAGSTTRYSFGGHAGKLHEHAWYNGVFGNAVHPVGRKTANAWGFHDMHGNVWEWCQDSRGSSDWFSAMKMPASVRMIRGGAWDTEPLRCRSAYAAPAKQDERGVEIGFRVLCEVDGAKP